MSLQRKKSNLPFISSSRKEGFGIVRSARNAHMVQNLASESDQDDSLDFDFSSLSELSETSDEESMMQEAVVNNRRHLKQKSDFNETSDEEILACVKASITNTRRQRHQKSDYREPSDFEIIASTGFKRRRERQERKEQLVRQVPQQVIHNTAMAAQMQMQAGKMQRANQSPLVTAAAATVLARRQSRMNANAAAVRRTSAPSRRRLAPQPPPKTWYYIDDDGVLFGGFSHTTLVDWVMAGYFHLEVPMRCGTDGPFESLRERIALGQFS